MWMVVFKKAGQAGFAITFQSVSDMLSAIAKAKACGFVCYTRKVTA